MYTQVIYIYTYIHVIILCIYIYVYHSFSHTYLYIYIHKSIKYNMICLISVRISHSYPGPALSSLPRAFTAGSMYGVSGHPQRVLPVSHRPLARETAPGGRRRGFHCFNFELFFGITRSNGNSSGNSIVLWSIEITLL